MWHRLSHRLKWRNLQSQSQCEKTRHSSPINIWMEVLDPGFNPQTESAFQWSHLASLTHIFFSRKLAFFKEEHLNHLDATQPILAAHFSQVFWNITCLGHVHLGSYWNLQTFCLWKEGTGGEPIPTWGRRNPH